MPADRDTLHIAAGATRDITFKLDKVGNHFYWAALEGLKNFPDREWLDSQLTGAFIVDSAGASSASTQERVWLITEWFHFLPKTRTFESALVFNGKAWPYNERLTFTQGDSVLPTTPGNWVFHCHFAGHVGELVSLHGSPDAHVVQLAGGNHEMAAHDAPGGHTMRGLVIGMHIAPKPGYKEPVVAERRTINLLIQKRLNGLMGGQTAYGFLVQSGAEVPARDSISIPGPVLELKRGQPVRILVKNNMDEPSGVHWHGLEIESFPDGVPGFSGIGDKIMPPIPPGESFVAEFTPPRSGTFPYHSHLHEMRQIGSGMYGAIIVSDSPRDTTRDHVIVAGGGGLPMFYKDGPAFLLVNGDRFPSPLRMTVGDTNRLRIVSVHADEILHFKFGTEEQIAHWTPLARDGADLPAALRGAKPAAMTTGPGETADFTYVPTQPGTMMLDVWIKGSLHVTLPVKIQARAVGVRR
jgi:hypothetical protein